MTREEGMLIELIDKVKRPRVCYQYLKRGSGTIKERVIWN